MTNRLSSVLSTADLPAAELDALRLDGEVFRVDECVSPLDEIPGPLLRAAALAAQLPPRLIAEQHSAAWVWGAQSSPPPRHEVCSDSSARARPATAAHLVVREVVLLHDDTVTIAGARVTTPIRTAIDLARFAAVWSDEERSIATALMAIGGFDAIDCARAMNDRRNLPGKKLAIARLASCEATETGTDTGTDTGTGTGTHIRARPQPEFTRYTS
jgi:hypothetical protein